MEAQSDQNTSKADMPDTRTCTCHPDDNPPSPCTRKFALAECREAELAKLAERNRYDIIGTMIDRLLANGELADYDDEIANRLEDAAKIVRLVTAMHYVPLRYIPGLHSEKR